MAAPKLRRKTIKNSDVVLPITSQQFTSTLHKRNRSFPSKNRPKRHETTKARVLLLLLLIWPFLLYLYNGRNWTTASAQVKDILQNPAVYNIKQHVGHLLHKKDLVGYGPRYPRLVIIITTNNPFDNLQNVIEAIRSIFTHTDRNRILSVIVVMDGIEESDSIKSELLKIDSGDTPHWHGMSYHSGKEKTDPNKGTKHKDEEEEEDVHHGKKIHVVFSAQKLGVAKSRQIGALFAKDLADKYEKAELKLKEEELILLLMREDARFLPNSNQNNNNDWLDAITAALILPELKQQIYKTHLSNAISFVSPSTTDTGYSAYNIHPTFDMAMNPTNSFISHEVDEPYAVPALHGALTAMRLNTFLSLPARDTALNTHYAADLELALNLWLCADGIDVLPQALVILEPTAGLPAKELTLDDTIAARLAAVWLDKDYLEQFYTARADAPNSGRSVESLKEYVEMAYDAADLPIHIQTKCRSISWYLEKFKEHAGVIKGKTRIVESSQLLPKQRKLIELSTDKLDILRTAKPIDLSYVDMSDSVSHTKALDEYGNDNDYVIDPTALRHDPPSFDDIFDKRTMCIPKSRANYKMLTEKVNVDMAFERSKEIKIFCIVYTIEKNHDRIPIIRETWGQKCDGFMVASDKTDPNLNTVAIPHEGEEAYNNIWQKVRSIWSYVYDNFYNDYDWFHIGGDDYYLIIENLRKYLESDEIYTAANGGGNDIPKGSEIPLFLGRRFAEQGNKGRIFNSGGSGYTLNKAALKTLVVIAFPECFPHRKTFAEDVMVAQCLRNNGVFPYETRDESGAERYMPFTPENHYNYRPPARNPEKDWYVKYTLGPLKLGLDHCSTDSVSFHYVKTDLMAKMHAILYKYCD